MAKKKKVTKKQRHTIRNIIVLLVIMLVLFIVLSLITPTEAEVVVANTTNGEIPDLELPYFYDTEQIVAHTGYTLSYNEEHEQANWVAYELTREEVYGGATEREDSFKADPLIKTGSASLADYRSSGYDRGHMAPAADFKWSVEAMSDTFYLSNMSPQEGSLNRGMWADLEAIVRQFAVDNEKVYVVTGPVLTDGPYKTIGTNKVSVPNQYYKVILDYTDPDIKAIGFVLPNSKPEGKIQDYAVSVNHVEKLTGIDFFPSLPDEIEESIEENFNVNSWNFSQFRASASDEKTIIEVKTPTSKTESTFLTIFNEVFYEFKKEVFSLLGITSLARTLNLI